MKNIYAITISICLFIIPVTRVFSYETGATLKTWENQLWYLFSDRTADYNGEPGLLSRYYSVIDNEHELDTRSYDYTLSEDYNWYGIDNGVRTWCGSVNVIHFFHNLDFKRLFSLVKNKLYMNLEFNREHSLKTKRDIFLLTLSTNYAFFRFTPKTRKDDIDLEFGLWKKKGKFIFSLSTALFDAFTDILYVGMGVDTAITKIRKEYNEDWRVFRGFLEYNTDFARSEIFWGTSNEYSLSIDSLMEKGRFNYAGILFEFKVPDNCRTGFVYKNIYHSESLSGHYSVIEKDFDYGFYNILKLRENVLVETRLDYIIRKENRDGVNGVNNIIEHEDTEIFISLLAEYAFSGKFKATLGYFYDNRDYRNPVYFRDLSARNHRLKLEGNWRAGLNLHIGISSNVDLDCQRFYDGASVKIIGTL